jgi:hypothetical protein
MRNGKYFFYLSAGSTRVAVVTSDHPNGPWHDPLGHALLEHGETYDPPTQIRDPGVLSDPVTGEFYIVFGTFNYYIAKLNADMISLAETPRHVTVDDIWAGQNGVNRTDDKPFLHVHNSTYYLSWGAFYGVSHSVYGPYEFVGTFIDPAHIAKDFRMPVDPAKPWYEQLDYKDRHGAFMELHGQWYFSTNDLSHSLDKASPNSYRDTVFSYVHYYPNGSIAPLDISAQGVNEHNASAGWIEAEEYFKLSNGRKGVHLALDRFEVVLQHGSRVEYHHVALGAHRALRPVVLQLRVRRANPSASATSARVRVVVTAQGGVGRTVTDCGLNAAAGDGYSIVDCALGVPPSSVVRLALQITTAPRRGGDVVHFDAMRIV